MASSSRYRRQQLDQLGLEYLVQVPNVDETPLENEPPNELCARLARAKARTVASEHRDAVVIGSDQVATFDNRILGKPGTKDRALDQLRVFSGQSIEFMTALHVCCMETGYQRTEVVTSEAGFRTLTDSEILRYIELDDPLDCAGSFKSEKAGIALLRFLSSEDPTAIIGLPLIALSQMLRENGLTVP